MDILQGLSQNQLGSLRMRQYKPGAIIFHQGDEAYGLFSVLQGKVEICKGSGPDAKRVATMGQGDVFGEMSLLLDSGKRSATARAVESSVVFEIPGNPVELARALPDPGVLVRLMENVIALLSERLRETNEAAAESGDRDFLARTISGEQTDFRGPLGVIAQALPQEAWLHKKVLGGETLCREGDESDGFYFIHEGKVAITKEENGEQRLMAKLSGPIMVGEAGCFAGDQRSATVSSITPVEFTYFPKTYFDRLRQSDPKQAAEILLAVARVLVHFITQPTKRA